MNNRTSAAVFSMIVGLAMIGIWVMLLLTGQVPELKTEPARISLHIAAEFITSLTLIVSGYLFFAHKAVANRLFLVGLGMLLYTVVQSSGYYIQFNQPGFVWLFAVLAVLGVYFVVASLHGNLVSE